jgi:hypothetical protein
MVIPFRVYMQNLSRFTGHIRKLQFLSDVFSFTMGKSYVTQMLIHVSNKASKWVNKGSNIRQNFHVFG